MNKFQVVTYNKVEQNVYGHWYVDAMHKEDIIFEFTKKTTEKDICKFLKEHKFLKTADMRRIEVSIGQSLIEVKEKKNSKPLCRLVLVR